MLLVIDEIVIGISGVYFVIHYIGFRSRSFSHGRGKSAIKNQTFQDLRDTVEEAHSKALDISLEQSLIMIVV
jgi:hypothetical protein